MVSNLSLSEKLQSRLSRSFHASRALRFVPKSLRFLFLEFPETFKLFSSCPSSFHLPEVSRLPFAGFLCYEIFMVLALFGHCPLFSEHLLFYHLLSCLSATFLFFSVFLSSSSWPLSSDSLSILPNHSLSVNTFFETFLSFMVHI